ISVNRYIAFVHDTTDIPPDTLAVCIPNLVSDFASELQLRVVPNPTNGMVHLETTTTGIKNIDIYDPVGRKVFSIHSQNRTIFDIDLTRQQPGIYFLNMNNGESSSTIKIALMDH